VKNNDFILIENDENLGFVKTCNKGMHLANGRIIVLLNSDTIIPSGFCERIKRCFESDKNIGVASPISSNSYSYYIKQPEDKTLEQMNSLLRKKHKPTYPTILSAEGFCFCIRKDVIQDIGYFDEIFGKGYHEEVDFAYRAFSNGWFNVLIDDLYVYHKKNASFGEFNSNELIVKNDKIFHERWDDFVEIHMADYLPENIISNIQNDIFSKNIVEQFFYFVKKHQICKTKHMFKKFDTNNKTVAIFALFNNDKNLSLMTYKYIKLLKNNCDYLIVVADKNLNKAKFSMMKQIADVILVGENLGINFDAYKMGFRFLKSIAKSYSPQRMIFADDSVSFVANDLADIFDDAKNKDFYCITQNNYGFIKENGRYYWKNYRYCSSYFLKFSEKILELPIFNEFMMKNFSTDTRISEVEKPEIELSNILQNAGFQINSFYPAIDNIKNIEGYYLRLPKSDNDKIYFVKNIYSFEYQLYDFIKNIKDEKIMFWGASNALKRVLNIFPKKNEFILGIIDRNKALCASSLGQYTIYHPDKLNELNPTSIMVTIKNNGNRLYDDIRTYIETHHPQIKVYPRILMN